MIINTISTAPKKSLIIIYIHIIQTITSSTAPEVMAESPPAVPLSSAPSEFTPLGSSAQAPKGMVTG